MPTTPDHDATEAYVFPPLPLEGLDAPLFSHLDRAAAEHPKRTAILFHNARVSYAKLLRLAETGAAALRQAGLKKGDRVAVMLPNSPQAIITYFAVLKAGGVCVMVNPLYMDFELRHQLADSGAKMLVILDLLWARHRTLVRELGLSRVFVTRLSDGLRFPLNFLFYLKMRREGKRPPIGVDNCTVFAWRTLFTGKARVSATDLDPGVDLAVLQYTGGTTGQAKGAMLTHRNLMANVRQCHTVLREVGITSEVFLGLLPYFHIYGLTVCVNFAVACAATMVPLARFIPAQTIKIIAKTRPTIFPGAPAVYAALLRQKDAARETLGSIRYCVSGSAPMSAELFERFTAATGAKILEGYGLTEASPITHVNPLEARRKPGSIGLPFPGAEARIVDMETGTMELGTGEQGELAVRGPQVMAGYWNRPEDTAQVLRDGWLLTGDVAIRDEQGYYFILDRKKDLILCGGFNVYPREIEEALMHHPAVKEACAVGVTHPSRGEAVKVYVVAEPEQNPSKAELLAYLRERLAGYKVPKYLEFREELPKTAVGKMLRRVLRDEGGATASGNSGSGGDDRKS
ncbi:long-chain-fatty-acid--CoA ligase [Desulfolutivibrio sp.]|uniref:long-chain-fatty-acid--CoA ligase n=1 Tax=Desulfolutivibrio sp. TaxID=2773296 RepID=UPI002F96A44B